MRHLLILVSIGFLFSQCASDSTSDTSVYDKRPEIPQKIESTESESIASADELNSAVKETIQNDLEEKAAAAEKEAEAKEAAKKAAAERKAKEKAAAERLAKEKAAAAAKKAAASAPKTSTDTRIRPTPRNNTSGDGKISTSVVSNPKTAASTPRVPAPKPILKWKTKLHDFGWVNEGEKVKFAYYFQNVGNEPLIILEANADCGCTVPSYPKRPVPPGGTGTIDVIFDTKSKAGRQDKKITILANTEPNYTDLRIQGMVDNRPKDKDEKGTTTASGGSSTKTSSQPGAGTKTGGSLLDKLKNKVEKDGD